MLESIDAIFGAGLPVAFWCIAWLRVRETQVSDGFSEPRSIYLQIADQIRDRILQGEWQDGERIPSIRELAIELGVNPNTVTRSYQALLDWGVVVNQRGRGYFVSDEAAERALKTMREEFVRDELPRVIRAMQMLGIGVDDLAASLAQQDGDQEK